MREADERPGVRVRQGFQQHAVNDREDGGVGAKTERQRQHDGERQTWVGVACERIAYRRSRPSESSTPTVFMR